MSKHLKYQELIEQMNLDEKASLMSGANFWNTKAIERLGIPSMMLTDGPHGLRKQGGKADHLGLNKSIPATCFPTAATLANSWDVELLTQVGMQLGKEAASENVSVLLGPGLNLKRNPLCGRNFEYFSEDPYLSGKLAASMIQGIQSNGISACPKHYAVNSQESHRMSVDEIVDQRALHELYLTGFRYAVCEGKPKTIMTAYNKVNGEYANENNYILDTVLQKQWGYDGLIVTDWGGNNDRVKGILAGNGLEMPSSNGMSDVEVVEAVKNGTLEETHLDSLIDIYLKLLFESIPALNKDEQNILKDNHLNAIEAATRSMVLLKNDDNILPITDTKTRIALIGDFAMNPRYQGAGSSLVNPSQLVNAIDAFRQAGYTNTMYAQGYKRYGSQSQSLITKAMKTASSSDIIILFIGLDESTEAEGVDRTSMSLQSNQLKLVSSLQTLNKPIVVVLSGGAPVELPFVDKVSAIVHTYLAGQGGAIALTNVISGLYNPSGKLAESYPVSYQDVVNANNYPGEERVAMHKESIYVGYRYYDKQDTLMTYPFGHGLSYTTFEYSNINYDNYELTVNITNTGNVFGEEIVQVYCQPLDRIVFSADKELKAFAKVSLAPNETKVVTLTLDEYAFSYYHIGKERWTCERGEYNLLVGASSKDIRLATIASIEGETVSNPYNNMISDKYMRVDVTDVSNTEFEQLLQRELPELSWDLSQPLTYESLIEHSRHAGAFGKLLYFSIVSCHKLLKLLNKPIAANNVFFVLELPFRSIARMSGGRINMGMLDGILMMVNGQFFKGLKHYLSMKRKD